MIGKNDQGMLEDLADRLTQALAASELAAGLRSLSQAGQRLKAGRPLTQGERLCLENQGNACPDWNRVRIESDAGLSALRGNTFEGDVLLSGFHGSWPGPDGRAWPAGMADCRVRDAVIGNACLYHIARLDRQVIDEGAVLVGVGELDCPAPTTFSLGRTIHPGVETGTRSLWLWDTLTLEDATAALSLTPDAQKAFRARLESLLAPLQSAFGFVGKGASVMHARHIHSAYIGPGARVAGASLIRESALLAAPGEPCVAAEEAWIEKSMLKPGARVESGGKVSQSFLMEGSEVGWGGMVSQSVIGPETHIHKGEVTACLLGPLVGFHHQSLLISALWPEGRGNIAYGANVGSNHTGKKPDQEIRPGEGNFFGLGCSIKFPANYQDAPYSLIATGVSTAPQRVAFPFSLINQPQGAPGTNGSDGGAAGRGLNEIVPGWMWSDNAYALVRRMYKFESGSAASRRSPDDDASSTWKTGFFAGRLFAAALAHKVLKAHQALRAAPPDRPFYLEDTLPGLGKNFLRGKGRAKALAAYEDYLAFFLMRAYADRPGEAWGMELSDLVAAIRKELAHGHPSVPDARSWAAGQRGRLPAFKASMLASLARDDQRGRQIFDDYSDFHPAPGDDAAVARLAGDLEELERRLEAFIGG
ncbi:MAG: DUF4954 family protein [Fibrobacteres bacterium]|nr:DUF4954 family protein [Fibrobacterota bacterium]